MVLCEQTILEDTVEIDTTPEKIWEFWANMDNNYKVWHPQDHILFRWTKGQPMEEGSKIYAEETAGGRLLKLKVTCVDVIPNKKFSLRLPFPDSLFASYKYVIEPRGNKTAFTAFTYLKYPGFTRRKIAAVIDVGKKHVKEEGENLKKILEESKV